MKTAVLVTKTDHCLNEILWRAELDELPIEITSIIGNRSDLPLDRRAGRHPVSRNPHGWRDREAGFAQIRKLIVEQDVELMVLARFMQILPQRFLPGILPVASSTSTTVSCPRSSVQILTSRPMNAA